MKYLVIIILSFLSIITLLLFPQNSPLKGDVPQSQCYKCHTSAKKLIEITREIAKVRPIAKAENEGEG